MAGILGAIQKGFGLAAKNLALVLALFLFNLVWNLAGIPLAVAPGATVTPRFTAAALIFSALFILASILVQGSVLGLVRDSIKEGKMQLAKFLSYGLKYYVRLLGLGVIIILVIAIVALVAGLIIAVTAPLNSTVITAIAITAAIAIAVVAGLFYFIPFTLSPYALICEDIGIVGSLKRSLDVALKPFSRVFSLLLLFVLLVLIALGIGFVIGFLVGMVTALVPAPAGKVLMAITTSVLNGYLGVVMTASFMTFYLSLAGSEKGAGEKVF